MKHTTDIKKINTHVNLLCPKYKEIRENTEYENWHEWCWPNDIFQDENYPCKKCELQEARYNHFLNETVELAKTRKDSNIHLIRKIWNKLAGDFVELGMNEVGILVAVTTTLEDYYWVFIDKDLHVRFDTCVDSCKKAKEIPNECSVLKYLHEHQSNELYAKVKQFIDESKYDKLITPIRICKVHKH